MIGRVIAGRYRLEARAGEGGIGAIFRARHLLIHRTVAVKIIRSVWRDERHHRAWFLREARAANRVNHPNIVDIYDFGDCEDGLYYLVMEYLRGQPLSRVIERGPLDLARATDILEQSCAAMARAHELGVVHRDIKSDNVFLIDREGRNDFVKVLDFGLAWLSRDRRLAKKGAVFGTPEYMSPEQTRGEDATPASDQYALGVLYYEMVTGRLPFDPPERKALHRMHQEVVPPRPSRFVPNLAPAAERIIMRMLQKRQEDRYPDASSLHDEVSALRSQLAETPSWVPSTPSLRRTGTPSVLEEPEPEEDDRPRVLLLDDSKMSLVMYGALLRAAGMEVHTASSLREFDDLLRTVDPSLILMDVMMPELDGDEVVPALRKRYTLDGVPVVLVSGLPKRELAVRATMAGASGYISKDVAAKRFVDKVRGFLSPSHRPTAIIVDDCQSSLILYGAVLRTAGMDVHTASTVSELDQLLETYDPTVILCDVIMPDIEIGQLVGSLRCRARTAGVPILLVSSLAEPELARCAQEVGADGYIPKELSVERFVDQVRAFTKFDHFSSRAPRAA